MTVRAFVHLDPGLRLHYGERALDALSKELERDALERAVIFCGASLAHDREQLERVRLALGDRCVGVYAGVAAHSPRASVEEAAQTLRELRADAVIALGGGSAIVTARAAAILHAEGKPATELCTRRQPDGSFVSPKLTAPKIAQFVIPTTPTTAIVKAGSAIFDPDSDSRLALFDPKTRARAVFIDPELVLSAPTELVMSASLNTLAMAVEGMESASGDALSDGLLMHALRLLAQYLPQLRQMPTDAELRGQLVLAAVLCGRGTDFTGGGLASVLGHALGARCHLANGLANAIVLPHTMRYNAPVTQARLARVAEALSPSLPAPASPPGHPLTSPAAITQVQSLLARLALPARLRDAGVAREQLDEVARAAMNDWFLTRNPRPVHDPADLTQLLLEAW